MLAAFGSVRMVWRSDLPVLELAGNYALWCKEAQRLLCHLSFEERATVMGENSRRLHRF